MDEKSLSSHISHKQLRSAIPLTTAKLNMADLNTIAKTENLQKIREEKKDIYERKKIDMVLKNHRTCY